MVVPGEWLYSIARAYQVDPAAIAVASGLYSIDQPLEVGWVLDIPDAPMQLGEGPTAAAQFDLPITHWTKVLGGNPQVIVAPATPFQFRYSYYDPALGGTNCSSFVGGYCVSRMASGERWEDWMNRAIACPREFPFWTRILFEGQEWICLDRGGAINYVEGVPWLDFLRRNAAHPYGSIQTATLVK